MFIRRLLNFAQHSYHKMSQVKPNIVFVLGGPGAGKGTQCENIVKQYGFVHLSAGDLLRAERARPESEVGAMIDDYIRKGEIVPVEVTCELLEKAMQESGKENFLIDGFPRNKDNLDGWNKAMGEKVNLKFVLFFDCSEEVCIERCLKRGQAGSGRSDDNIESLRKRINTYNDSTIAIIDHYRQQDLVRRVDARMNIEQVFAEVKKLFS